MMSASLVGGLALTTEHPMLGAPLWVQMTITNHADQAVTIVNPEVGIPPADLKWRASNEAYQMAVLMSFGLLQISLKELAGAEVERQGAMPWVTPLLGKRTLPPQASMTLDFDLTELFAIHQAGRYDIQVRYGEDSVYADATLTCEIMPHRNVAGV